MAIAVVEQLKQALHDQPQIPLRPNVRKSWEDEAERLEAIVNAPPWVSRGASTSAQQSLKRLKKQLGDQAAKRIEDPIRRDRVAQLSAEVLREVILPAMQSHAVMRRNPPGAVDGFFRGENAPPVKDAILAWKRAQFALDPTTEDNDHANLEKYRPTGTVEGAPATYMVGAQIPGHFAFGARAGAHWPAEMPPQGTLNHPLAQAQHAQAVATEPAPPKPRHRPARPKLGKRVLNLTPEQRAARGARLKAARAAKYAGPPDV